MNILLLFYNRKISRSFIHKSDSSWQNEKSLSFLDLSQFTNLKFFDWWRGQVAFRKSPERLWIFLQAFPKVIDSHSQRLFYTGRGENIHVSWITSYWFELIISGEKKCHSGLLVKVQISQSSDKSRNSPSQSPTGQWSQNSVVIFSSFWIYNCLLEPWVTD